MTTLIVITVHHDHRGSEYEGVLITMIQNDGFILFAVTFFETTMIFFFGGGGG